MRRTLLLILLLLLACLLSLGTGPYPVLDGLRSGDPTAWKVLIYLRLPRAIAAFLVGAALSLAGSGLQTLLRNPLADPFVLGVSSGAAAGMLASLMLGFSPYSISTFLLAFLGGALTVWSVAFMGTTRGRMDTTRMLLSGVILNAFFASLILMGLSYVHHRQLSSYMHWMMGNLSDLSLGTAGTLAPLLILGALPLLLLTRQLDVFLLGEETASSSGISVERLKRVVFFSASFLTAMTVALVGIIGFVGLIVPNLCRRWWGSSHTVLFATSTLLGGAFLVLADSAARFFPGGDLPAGAVTALVGAPFFLMLLGRDT